MLAVIAGTKGCQCQLLDYTARKVLSKYKLYNSCIVHRGGCIARVFSFSGGWGPAGSSVGYLSGSTRLLPGVLQEYGGLFLPNF
jgi:hypothetical protein